MTTSWRYVAVPPVLDDLPLPSPDARLYRMGGETMGTTWNVTISSSDLDEPAVRSAVENVLQGIIDEMSTWLPSSVLSTFNRSHGEWMPVPRDLETVLACALQVAEDSQGAYDPTVGPLVDLWGFGPPGSRTALPADSEIDAARLRTGWTRVTLDRLQHRARQPGGVAVDLSAIAKGFAVDAVATRLDALALTSYLVEIGGELRGRGVKPDVQPWWVAIEPPADDAGPPRAPEELIVALHGLSVATSGDYRRQFTSSGRHYSHTIDPRTGRPVTHTLASVSVLHRECMMADALATAITVLGPEDGMAFAVARDISAFLVERTPGGLRRQASPALQAMLQ